jgi:hypothetical protein
MLNVSNQTRFTQYYREGEAPSGELNPFGSNNLEACFHLQVACQQRSDAIGREECLLCPESL